MGSLGSDVLRGPADEDRQHAEKRCRAYNAISLFTALLGNEDNTGAEASESAIFRFCRRSGREVKTGRRVQ